MPVVPSSAASPSSARGAGPETPVPETQLMERPILDPAFSWAPPSTRPGPTALVPLTRLERVEFADRYVPLELLGAGSYAEVFRAQDVVTGAEVALKVLHDRVSDSAIWPARERFEREVALMRDLNHPGVVPVTDAGYLRDPMLPSKIRPALVMPIVAGETLATVIERREAWDVSRVVAFLRATVRVLVHLQAHGVVHRDLGPQNIFVTPAAQPAAAGVNGGPDGDTFQISDFGMARPLDAAVVTRLSGTLTEAMANRLIYTDHANREGVITSASDLVSLARIAIALLRGGHYNGALTPGMVAEVPEGLRTLLNQQAADGAFGDPAQFLAALEHALQAPPQAAARAGAPADGRVTQTDPARAVGGALLAMGLGQGPAHAAEPAADGPTVAAALAGILLALALAVGAWFLLSSGGASSPTPPVAGAPSGLQDPVSDLTGQVYGLLHGLLRMGGWLTVLMGILQVARGVMGMAEGRSTLPGLMAGMLLLIAGYAMLN